METVWGLESFIRIICLARVELRRDAGANCVKTTPQMTHFRDAKVCNNMATGKIDDHRIQSDYECTVGQKNPEGKNSTLGIAYAW